MVSTFGASEIYGELYKTGNGIANNWQPEMGWVRFVNVRNLGGLLSSSDAKVLVLSMLFFFDLLSNIYGQW